EDRLQELLARYPDVLAGNQMSRAAPRRWVLVAREVAVPDAAESAGRWSLDHLFLDQDGIPTLVEVKRSVDTRIRREVVGQMLDYAANAAVYWKTPPTLATGDGSFLPAAATPDRQPAILGAAGRPQSPLGQGKMKITDIRTIDVGAPPDEHFLLNRNWTFVLIDTDEGITGIGDATLLDMDTAVIGVIQHLRNVLLGQDPTRVEHLWQQMYRHPFWRGGPVLGAAISGIDMALWDIAGKVAGMPVYKMLGGAVRDRVRCYVRNDFAGTAVDQALEARDAGFGGIKYGPEAERNAISELELADVAADMTAEIRAAVGPKMDLMIDFHGRLTPPAAIRALQKLEPLDVFFAEELIPPDNIPAYAEVARAVPGVPVATGERLYTRWGFRELIETRAVPIIQPDICYAGGISELRRIAAHAETHYIQVAPHNPNGPVATAANLHFAAATPNFLVLEYARKKPYFEEALAEPLVVKDGHFELPTGPGLGIELDFDYIAKHPRHLVPIGSNWHADGSAADV
ncbi:MAG TPA: galactonate dehydratase, partial [Chloroflexota bacterium]|nr:galactonate dehydratase [Chloroflexota bacterium]